MLALIIGSGRVGSTLAKELIELGVEVIVLDDNEENLDKVKYLDCTTVKGMPLETAVLEKAGIANVDTVLCVSDNENMNIMIGQVVQKLYGIQEVLCRIFLPENEAFYKELGLKTICSTSMTKDKVLSYLGFAPAKDQTDILGFPVQYELKKVKNAWDGKSVFSVEQTEEFHIVAVLSEDESMRLVQSDYILSAGESIVLLRLGD